uniref:V-SNARE coiled-coil homology domain-containing protein n=1 Tax=Magallana gigas TaxID=29159 RepID=K1QB29_MAGGI
MRERLNRTRKWLYTSSEKSLVMYPEFLGINKNKEQNIKENYIKLRNVSCLLNLILSESADLRKIKDISQMVDAKSDDEFEIIEMQDCKGIDEDGLEMTDMNKPRSPKSPKIHISRTKNNNESSHNENIELLHERRDKLTNLAASSENLANKTQQYRDNMKAVNKTMARRRGHVTPSIGLLSAEVSNQKARVEHMNWVYA